ncbi:ABC transporter ATP-binding protein (plasmid) [Paraburkholderia sp. PREW-6R]|uniref:ABC transporter ATP-binding protein n=1 Tax=Paraburkholderia sp. PREW-6R TaxID=3141544 RepID=UPI0031F53E78
MSALLRVRDLSISFGGIRAVDNVSFSVERGQITSIIGPNGAGKTTLFNMISGMYKPGQGQVFLDDVLITGKAPFELARMGMSRTFQNLQVFMGQTAVENVMIGRQRWERSHWLADLLGLPSVHGQNRHSRDASLRMLDQVGLARHADSIAGSLSYGSLKRLEIARALATEPSVMLLDEPAAGCNGVETAEIEQIVRQIAALGVTIVVIEHDMKMVMRMSDSVLVLNQGRTLLHGTPAEVRADPRVIEAYLGTHAKDIDHAQA